MIFPKPGKKSNTASPPKTNTYTKSNTVKEEASETRSSVISSNLKELVPEEKKSEPEIIEENKEQNIEIKEEEKEGETTPDIIEGRLNIENAAEILNTEKNIEIQNIPSMPESTDTRAETVSKDQSSTKASKVDDTPLGQKESTFSVEGYSDTENMW